MSELTGKTIAFLVAPEGIEQVELTHPWGAVESAGGTPRLLSTTNGSV
jgi:protease I